MIPMIRYFYPSIIGPPNNKDSVCGVSYYPADEKRNAPILVISQLKENTGTSITNRAKLLFERLVQEYNLDPHNVIYIEHYSSQSSVPKKDTYNLVTFTVLKSGQPTAPQWKPLSLTEVRELLNDEPPRGREMVKDWGDLPLILTVDDTASLLRVTVSTIKEMCVSGQLPANKVGRAWRIDKDIVLNYVRNSL